MTKFLIYTVASAILVLFGVNIYLMATGQASTQTIIETAITGAVIITLAIAAFVKTIKNSSWDAFSRKPTPKPWESDKESLESDIESLRDEYDSFKDSVEQKISDLKESIGNPADAWVATINTTDDYGKLVKVYDLPPEDDYDTAIEKANESIESRIQEGQPVHNPVITVVPCYFH